MAVDTQLAAGDYVLLRNSFRRALLAQNKAPRTVATYLAAVDELGAFLTARGMPLVLAHIRREHLEHWVAALLSHRRPATVSVRYRAVQQFFR